MWDLSRALTGEVVRLGGLSAEGDPRAPLAVLAGEGGLALHREEPGGGGVAAEGNAGAVGEHGALSQLGIKFP